MSRHRDYQPTIDRARSQVEVAKLREAKLRAKSDDYHRAMLRAQVAARIADEEAQALRDRFTGLEQSVRDLRRDNKALAEDRGRLVRLVTKAHDDLDRARHPLLAAWFKVREWFADMLKIGAEA